MDVTLVLDITHWLNEDGSLPFENPKLLKRALRAARFVEYGGELGAHQARETLVDRKKRPRGKACLGVMWVVKQTDGSILVECPACKDVEVTISNWEKTDWAHRLQEPLDIE